MTDNPRIRTQAMQRFAALFEDHGEDAPPDPMRASGETEGGESEGDSDVFRASEEDNFRVSEWPEARLGPEVFGVWEGE